MAIFFKCSFTVLFFLDGIQFSFCLARTECVRSGSFQKTRKDFALPNHVITIHRVLSRIDCTQECLGDKRCVTYNFQENSKNGKHTCELNDQTEFSAEESLQKRDGYSYYEAARQIPATPACVYHLCHKRARCMDGCGALYVCQCPSWRTGRHCDLWTVDAHKYALNYSTRSTSKFAVTDVNLSNTEKFHFCFRLRTTEEGPITLFSYTSKLKGREMAFKYKGVGEYQMELNSETTSMYSAPLNDGKWHHVCVKWFNENGTWDFFVDASRRVSGSGFATDYVIQGGGQIVTGQSRLSYGGPFNASESFVGEISQLNLKTENLINSNVFLQEDECSVQPKNQLNWRDFRENISGKLHVTPSPGCSAPLTFALNVTTRHSENYAVSTITEPLDALTACVWLRLRQDQVLVYKYSVKNTTKALVFWIGSHSLNFYINGKSSAVYVEPVGDNSWHHYCHTWRGDTGELKMFVDGSLRKAQENFQIGQTVSANGDFKLGQTIPSVSQLDNFIGIMSGLNLWNKALIGSVVSIMSKASGYESGNVLAWSVLKDSVHGAVLIKPTNLIKSRVPATAFTLEFPGKSTTNFARFSGVIPSLTTVTTCAWVKPGSGTGGIYHYATKTYANAMSSYIESATIFNFHIKESKRVVTVPSLQYGWHQICFLWRGSDGQYTVYANDKKIKSEVGLKTGATIEAGGVFLLGQEMDSIDGDLDRDQSYSGRLAHVNVWSKELAENVLKVMATGCSALEGNVVYWSGFRNDVRGDTIVHSSSNCMLPSYTTLKRRNEYCEKNFGSDGSSPLKAIFDRNVRSTGKLWRCYVSSSWKQNSRGLYKFDVLTNLAGYYTRSVEITTFTD